MEFSERLIHFHEKLVQFFEKHLRTVLTIIFIFVIIGLLWGGFTYYKSKKEKEASLKLMEVTKSSNIPLALKEVKEKYKGTSTALQASLLLLDYYFYQKNYQETEKLINEIEKEYPKKIKGIILYGKAKILEIKGDLNKALKIYQKISKNQPDLSFLIYLDIARLAEKLGKIDLAKEYYQKYINDPNVKNSGFAEYKLYQLNTKK